MSNDGNLKPWKPGQSGNPQGRPRGAKGWAPTIRTMLYDEELVDKLIKKQPVWYENLEHKNMASLIVVAMMMKAAEGDVRAATWLASYSSLDDEKLAEDAPNVALVRFVSSLSDVTLRQIAEGDPAIIEESPLS